MNMLDGKLSGEGGNLTFETNAGSIIPVPKKLMAALSKYSGEEFTVGIRPEHTGETPDSGSKIALTVIDVEPLGPHTLLIGEVGTERFTAQFSSTNKAQPDDVVDVYLDVEKVHFFRGKDGLAIR
jgi:multiple sugar transport system ATP-binding protein